MQPSIKATGRAKERKKRAATNDDASPGSLHYTQSSEYLKQEAVPRNCYHAKLLGHTISGVIHVTVWGRSTSTVI